MLIAFEGPDETGKSSSATELSHNHKPHYNATKMSHTLALVAEAEEPFLVRTFDRIDWFTHMIYRLAMPTRDWNDDRPRTVFAMPTTHLVVKLHEPSRAEQIATTDEPYQKGELVEVNGMYGVGLNFLLHANRLQDFELFKTISVMVVDNDQSGKLHSFTQRLLFTDRPDEGEPEMLNVPMTNGELLEYLQDVDHQLL